MDEECQEKENNPEFNRQTDQRLEENKGADDVIGLVKRNKGDPWPQSQPSFEKGEGNVSENNADRH